MTSEATSAEVQPYLTLGKTVLHIKNLLTDMHMLSKFVQKLVEWKRTLLDHHIHRMVSAKGHAFFILPVL